MKKKVTLNTLEAIMNEVDKASLDKSRVISDIQNKDVRCIIQECSDYSFKHGIAGLGIAAGLGMAGAAGGIVAGGVGAAEGAAAGAAAGAPFPIVGPIIGGGVGILVGVLVGGAITAKQKQKRERIYQEAIGKQNGQIMALIKEVQDYQDKSRMKDEEIARLKYLLGVLLAYSEGMGLLGTL